MPMDMGCRARIGSSLRATWAAGARRLSLLLAAVGLLAGCAATSPPESTDPVLRQAALGYLAQVDAAYAGRAPSTGLARWAWADPCYLHDGRELAELIAAFERDPQAEAEPTSLIGSRRELVSVRDRGRAPYLDGTFRHEIVVRYRIHYTDGRVAGGEEVTLVSGTTSGMPMADGTACRDPETSPRWRMLGNRRPAHVSIRALNARVEHRALSTGELLRSGVLHGRGVEFIVRDFQRRFTYAILTVPSDKPGFAPLQAKLIAPLLRRDEAVFHGQRGHLLDLRDNEPFAFCLNADGTVPSASDADCGPHGASGFRLGVFGGSNPAGVDTDFDAIGMRAGTTYRFDLYTDDGWRTRNGHAGKLPAATFDVVLEQLPYRASALAGLAGEAGGYPVVTALSPDGAEAARGLAQRGAHRQGVAWSLPEVGPEQRPLAFSSVVVFKQGRVGAEARWPAVRTTMSAYPTGSASVELDVPSAVSRMAQVDRAEVLVWTTDRAGRRVLGGIVFQPPPDPAAPAARPGP